MYIEHFYRARDYLTQHGLKPSVVMGSPVSESDLKSLDGETDFPMPLELRQFYLEMGDGFAFIPDDRETSKFVGWDPMHLADHRISNKGFGSAIEEDASDEIDNPSPHTDPKRLTAEMERRKRWMPFYGFVGGGDVLCLDLNSTPPTVRSYQSQVWPDLPRKWDFLLAKSFTEFVERWSRFHFLSPAGSWTSFCTRNLTGQFDWAPAHFPQIPAKG